LNDELEQGPRRGSALLRRALAEVADGIRSSAEGDLRDLIKRAGLPVPLFNARLFADGRLIAVADCWWPDAGVAAEVDSREWHFSPRDWEQTMRRHEAMGAHGIITLHFTPRRIRQEPGTVAKAIRDALAAGQARGPLAIHTQPASA
jgi:peptidoglycan/xylan/chitin deacetylase (PgdA/CDA1 family)